MQSSIMNSHEVFIHIHQGCFAGTGAIVRLPQCQWSKPDGYGKISQCITTTKHSKAKTVCIFLGIYCRRHIRYTATAVWFRSVYNRYAAMHWAVIGSSNGLSANCLRHYLNQSWYIVNKTIRDKPRCNSLSKNSNFCARKCIWTCVLQNISHFVQMH